MLYSKKIREALLIQTKEKDSVRYLFIFSFFLGFPQISTITASSTILLKYYSPDIIPVLFLLNGLTISLLSLIFLKLLRIKGIKKSLLVLSFTLFSGSLLLTVTYLLIPGVEFFALLLFLWSRIENTFLTASFLIIANSILTPRESRRVLAFTSSGQVLSLIIGGFLFPILLKYIEPINLMWFSITAHVILFFHLNKFKPLDDSVTAFQHKRIDRSTNGTSLLRNISITFLLAYLLYYVIDSAFLTVVDNNIQSSKETGIYFSRFWLIVGLSALFCKTLITGKLLHKLGTISGLLFPPILLITYYIITRETLSPLILNSGLKFLERVLFASIFMPAFYTLFQGFNHETKVRVQLISEAVLTQVSAIITGLFFIYLRKVGRFNLEILIFLMIIISVFIIFYSLIAYKSYKNRVYDILKKPVILSNNEYKKEDKDIVVDDSLLNTRLYQLKDFSSYIPDKWSILLYDVWLYEWNNLISQTLAMLSIKHKDPRIIERWNKIKVSDGSYRGQLIEGYAQLLHPPEKEFILSIISNEEPFLLEKSIKILKKTEFKSCFTFSSSNSNLSDWSKNIIDLKTDLDENSLIKKYKLLYELKKSQFFKGIPTEYLRTLLPSLMTREYQPSENVINEGDEGDSIFILISGRVEILKGFKKITEISEGSCIGELALILPEKRSATVKTVTTSTFIELPGKDFMNFINIYPNVIENIQQELFLRMEALIDSELSFKVRNSYTNESIVHYYEVLKDSNIFKNLSDDLLKNLVLNSKSILLGTDKRIILDSDKPMLILIITGELEEYWGDKKVKTWNSKQVPGTQHLIRKSKYNGSLLSKKESELLLISTDVYTSLLLDEQIFQQNLLKQLVYINRLLLTSS